MPLQFLRTLLEWAKLIKTSDNSCCQGYKMQGKFTNFYRRHAGQCDSDSQEEDT